MKITMKRRLRKPRPPGEVRRRPINVLASVMTTMGLYLGTMSIFASIGLEFQMAAYCILGAIVFDMLDGFVARITRSTSEFGKELDSLCDAVSFGVAPAVLVFMAYLPEGFHLPVSARAESIVGKTGSYMAIIYVICTVLRLARFNTYQADRKEDFVGLPSPAAGASIASMVLFLQYFEPRFETHHLGALAYFALGPTAVLLALLMVSTVRYPKNRLKAFILAPRHAFTALGVCAFIIAIIHYAMTTSPAILFFPLTVAYVSFGVVDTAYNKWFKRPQAKTTDSPSGNAALTPHEAGVSGGVPSNKTDFL